MQSFHRHPRGRASLIHSESRRKAIEPKNKKAPAEAGAFARLSDKKAFRRHAKATVIKIGVYDDAIEIHSTADFAPVLPLVGISLNKARTAREIP